MEPVRPGLDLQWNWLRWWHLLNNFTNTELLIHTSLNIFLSLYCSLGKFHILSEYQLLWLLMQMNAHAIIITSTGSPSPPVQWLTFNNILISHGTERVFFPSMADSTGREWHEEIYTLMSCLLFKTALVLSATDYCTERGTINLMQKHLDEGQHNDVSENHCYFSFASCLLTKLRFYVSPLTEIWADLKMNRTSPFQACSYLKGSRGICVGKERISFVWPYTQRDWALERTVFWHHLFEENFLCSTLSDSSVLVWRIFQKYSSP